MESFESIGGSRLVVTDLSYIKQLVTQLEVHLGESPDLCKRLASQIFSLTERSIGIITSSDFDSGRKRSAADAGLASVPSKTTTKRRLMEKRKDQARVSSAGGGETPVDDGHSWRKYGQKEILGAKYPRGYYRCTHRHSQGCAATKQVQRTDEDPALFDVFYVGMHTCVHKTTAAAGQATQPPERNPDAHGPQQSPNANLAVKTEELAAEPQGWSATTTPLCTSSTPASVCLAPERSPFSAPSTSDNWGASPATSDSNHVASFAPFDTAEWRAHFELREVVSALVVASTPPVPSLDITDELLDIDIDISSFFA